MLFIKKFCHVFITLELYHWKTTRASVNPLLLEAVKCQYFNLFPVNGHVDDDSPKSVANY